MILANMVYSGVRLSRPLDENELLEFEDISYININEVEYTGVFILVGFSALIVHFFDTTPTNVRTLFKLI